MDRRSAIYYSQRWLAPQESSEAVARFLSSMAIPKPLAVHISILLLRGDLNARLKQRVPQFLDLHLVDKTNDTSLYRLRIKHEKLADEHELYIRASMLADAPIAIIMTIASNAQWRHGVQRLIDWMYPFAYQPFLRQDELRSIFDLMQSQFNEDGLRIRIKEVSGMRRLLNKQARRHHESERTWTDIDFDEAFEQATESQTYFRKILFDVCRQESRAGSLVSVGVTGTVAREARFSINSRVLLLYNAAVKIALQRAEHDYKLAKDRGRGDSSNPSPPTIIAKFRDDTSVQQEDLPMVVARLKKLPNASVSILHANPYLHASIVDMNDGSSFDLVLASDRNMLIVPQLRATEGAVTRICSYIYDQIGEAEFLDASLFQ